MARASRSILIIAISLVVLLAVIGLAVFGFLHSFGGGPIPGTPTTGSGCNGTGVTKNADGTYHFSRLHIGSQGQFLDESNCVVHLLGINQGLLFEGNANATTNLKALEEKMAFFHQNLPANIVRVNYNSYWWNTDAYVPAAHMHFKQWLQTYVRLEEQAGNYVELDTGPNFHNPPCGNDHMGVNIKQCASQNQAQKNGNTDATESIYYEPPAIQSLTDLAKLYANDPAVIFDVWNEPATKGVSEASYFADMNQRIDAVRAQDPQAIVVVYSRFYSDIARGAFPNYKQGNLVLDYHTYNADFTASSISSEVQYAQAHGQGTVVNEYGGGEDSPNAQQQLTTLSKTMNVGLLYFESTNLTDNKNAPFSLNDNGNMVHSSYTSILGG